jgi:hypothetical protein
MRRILRVTSAIMALCAAVLWLALGANRAWTKTEVPIKTLDAVTGIEGIVYKPRFVPGLDFLAVALVGAAMILGVSYLPPASKSNSQPPPH